MLDQVLKNVVVGWIGRGADIHRWEVLGRWIALEYVENTGAAFGMLAGQPVLLSALAIVVTVAFLVMMRDEAGYDPAMLAAVGCVVGGSLGNLVDRLRLGYVVDFVAIGIWPKFNLADSAIVIGLALMAWTALVGEPNRHGIETGTHAATSPAPHNHNNEGNGRHVNG